MYSRLKSPYKTINLDQSNHELHRLKIRPKLIDKVQSVQDTCDYRTGMGLHVLDKRKKGKCRSLKGEDN